MEPGSWNENTVQHAYINILDLCVSCEPVVQKDTRCREGISALSYHNNVAMYVYASGRSSEACLLLI